MFGYRSEPVACQRHSGILAGSRVVPGQELQDLEEERMAKDLQVFVSHSFTQMITEIKCVSSRLGSSGTETAYSSSSINLKLFPLLNSPLLCLLGNEGEDTDLVFAWIATVK